MVLHPGNYHGMSGDLNWRRAAVALLLTGHGPQPTRDLVEGVFAAFRLAAEPLLGAAAIAAIRVFLDDALPPALPTPDTPDQATCAARWVSAILPRSRPIPRATPAATRQTFAAVPGGSCPVAAGWYRRLLTAAEHDSATHAGDPGGALCQDVLDQMGCRIRHAPS